MRSIKSSRILTVFVVPRQEAGRLSQQVLVGGKKRCRGGRRGRRSTLGWQCGCRGRRQKEGRGRQECVDEVLVDCAASARGLDALHPPPPFRKVGP
eukprot:scaffold60684_cov58-Phaeocystis_antarctica.AAC.1